MTEPRPTPEPNEPHDHTQPINPSPPKASNPWANLFKQNRNISKSVKLKEYTEEDRILEFKDLKNLGYCLVGYVLGKFPGLKAIEGVRNSWKVPHAFSIHESGWMTFKFDKESDRDLILANGPYETFGSPWLLKNRPAFFSFNDASFGAIPSWITLPGLPLECWSEVALGKIASYVGKPIATDQLTMTMERTSYARILVEVDATKPLVRSISIPLPNGATWEQMVIFEREPIICEKCRRIGHDKEHCKAKMHAMTKRQGKPQGDKVGPIQELGVTAVKTINAAVNNRDCMVVTGQKGPSAVAKGKSAVVNEVPAGLHTEVTMVLTAVKNIEANQIPNCVATTLRKRGQNKGTTAVKDAHTVAKGEAAVSNQAVAAAIEKKSWADLAEEEPVTGQAEEELVAGQNPGKNNDEKAAGTHTIESENIVEKTVKVSEPVAKAYQGAMAAHYTANGEKKSMNVTRDAYAKGAIAATRVVLADTTKYRCDLANTGTLLRAAHSNVRLGTNIGKSLWKEMETLQTKLNEAIRQVDKDVSVSNLAE